MPVGKEVLELGSTPFASTLLELGFDKAELERTHPGFIYYFRLDRQLLPEMRVSRQHFELCEDADGRPIHFSSGYLYVSVVPDERPQVAEDEIRRVTMSEDGHFIDDRSYDSH